MYLKSDHILLSLFLLPNLWCSFKAAGGRTSADKLPMGDDKDNQPREKSERDRKK